MSTHNITILFDAAGFFLSICSLTVVLGSSKMTLARIKQGFSMLALGFGFMALSFAWSILFNRLALAEMPNMQMPLLVFGVASVFFSALRLFVSPQDSASI